MIKRFLLVLVFVLLMFNLACKKENEHKVRFNNKYETEISDIFISELLIGTVQPGILSNYVSVKAGAHRITFTTPDNQFLDSELFLTGEGEHRWTISIYPNGTVDLKED